MTKNEIIEAFAMRLEGYSYREIADKYGVSSERIRQIVGYGAKGRKVGNAKCIYPNLTKWVIENGDSFNHINKETGICSSSTGFYQKLKGTSRLTICDIKKILEYTGMTFEEAFGVVREDFDE